MLDEIDRDQDVDFDRAIRPVMPLRLDAFRRRRRRSIIFSTLFLVLPPLLVGLYLYLICSSIFEIDTVAMIRSPAMTSSSAGAAPSAAASLLGAGGQSAGGMSRAIDESYAVVQFVQSREALRLVEARIGYARLYADPAIDWWHRLPANADFEQRYRHYTRHVNIYYDDVEGQVDLSVTGFSAAATYALSRALMEASEKLVNDFNYRAQHDFITLASQHADAKKAAFDTANLQVRDFRVTNAVIDPSLISTELGGIITTLTQQAATVQSNIDAVQKLGLGSAGLAPMRNQLASLRAEIARQQSKLTGGNGPLARVLAEFADVTTAQQVAQQEYISAVAMREAAIFTARHQALYVVDIVPPRTPEEPHGPRRLLDIAIAIGATIAAWIVSRVVIAAIRDHLA